MNSLLTNSVSRSLSRAVQVRHAILMAFCDSGRTECSTLLHLSSTEWQHLLRWLDTSGLALYFLDRLEELGLLKILPPPALARLLQNRSDNHERMEEMIREAAAIQSYFQEAGLSYAVVKGFSLWPISVPKFESRSQLDLDFLVAEESAMEAKQILEDCGYRLHVASGRHMDFKANEGPIATLDGLYKPGMCRSAELHIEAVRAGQASTLARAQQQTFHGFSMRVLDPVDLFLGQGLHLYKHVCSQFSRAAHLIEFRRHVIARYYDEIFWGNLQRRISSDRSACIRLGLVTHLIERVMGPFAPAAFTRFTVDQLPANARLWVEIYGLRSVLAAAPGSKLYLLLEKELQKNGLPLKRSMWQALVPRRLPRSIGHPVIGESPLARLERHRRQLLYMCVKLRFSILEGIRFLHESILWRQYRNGPSQ
jgi:hypothetical protein